MSNPCVFSEFIGAGKHDFLVAVLILVAFRTVEASQLVAGTMSTHVVDTLGGTPSTDWVFKPNFHGPNFTYFEPNLDGLSVAFGEQFRRLAFTRSATRACFVSG